MNEKTESGPNDEEAMKGVEPDGADAAGGSAMQPSVASAAPIRFTTKLYKAMNNVDFIIDVHEVLAGYVGDLHMGKEAADAFCRIHSSHDGVCGALAELLEMWNQQRDAFGSGPNEEELEAKVLAALTLAGYFDSAALARPPVVDATPEGGA